MPAHHVAIVFNPDFGEALRTLSRQLHVWIVDTPANKKIAREIWLSNPEYSLESGVTTIDRTGYPDVYGLFERILSAVDEHHGVYGHEPTWSVLHIYGLVLDDQIRALLDIYCATTTDELADHFTTSRQPPPSMIAPE